MCLSSLGNQAPRPCGPQALQAAEYGGAGPTDCDTCRRLLPEVSGEDQGRSPLQRRGPSQGAVLVKALEALQDTAPACSWAPAHVLVQGWVTEGPQGESEAPPLTSLS